MSSAPERTPLGTMLIIGFVSLAAGLGALWWVIR